MRFWFAVLSTGLIGCGGDTVDRETVYPVTGKITTPAGPLADAAVSFAPKGQQPTAFGRTNAQGEFTLRTYEEGDGAAAGDYAVVVTKVISQPAAAESDAGHSADPGAPGPSSAHAAQPPGTGAVSEIPAKYMSSAETPLTATVTADGPKHFEFTVE